MNAIMLAQGIGSAVAVVGSAKMKIRDDGTRYGRETFVHTTPENKRAALVHITPKNPIKGEFKISGGNPYSFFRKEGRKTGLRGKELKAYVNSCVAEHNDIVDEIADKGERHMLKMGMVRHTVAIGPNGGKVVYKLDKTSERAKLQAQIEAGEAAKRKLAEQDAEKDAIEVEAMQIAPQAPENKTA